MGLLECRGVLERVAEELRGIAKKTGRRLRDVQSRESGSSTPAAACQETKDS